MKIKFLCLSITVLLSYTSCQSQYNPKLVRTNEAIAVSFMESLNSHDISKLISLFSENCLYEEVATGRRYTGRNNIAAYIRSTIDGIPDTKFKTVNILANDSLAVVEWLWTGTNSVGWAEMGIPATNKSLKLQGLSIMKIKNGLITRNRDYWDWNSFIRGIGADQD